MCEPLETLRHRESKCNLTAVADIDGWERVAPLLHLDCISIKFSIRIIELLIRGLFQPTSIGLYKSGYQVNIFFLFLHEIICCGYSLEAPCQGALNEYQQYTFS